MDILTLIFIVIGVATVVVSFMRWMDKLEGRR